MDKEELRKMIDENRFMDLIRVFPIKKGDFFQIEPGTVHAIKKGTMILETQQNSDITYRLYDYDRLDHGKPRELHIEKSIDVIRCPHIDSKISGKKIEDVDYELEELIVCSNYTVQRIKIHGEHGFLQEHKFLNVSVIEGSGWIDALSITKGDHFILPFGYGSFVLKGNLELIVSHI
jgi:mannose-6-phosphate isomerase class I